MRSFIAISLIAVLALPAAFAAPPRTVVLKVENMTCPVCPITVRKSLERVAGVSAAKVDYQQRIATVSYDPDRTSPAELMRATTNAGFPSTLRE